MGLGAILLPRLDAPTDDEPDRFGGKKIPGKAVGTNRAENL
jgi:hypothetical protein